MSAAFPKWRMLRSDLAKPKMPGSSHYIALEGPIGVGKTDLACLFGYEASATTLLDPVEDAIFLKRCFESGNWVAFLVQMSALVQHYRQLRRIPQQRQQKALFISNYTFAKNRILATLTLRGSRLSLHAWLYSALARGLPLPSLVIYLRADPESLVRRIAKQGWPFAEAITNDHLPSLCRAYEEFFSNYTEAPLAVLDATSLEVLNRCADHAYAVCFINAAVERETGLCPIADFRTS